MNLQQFARRDGQFARKYDYGDRTTIAVDLDTADGDVDVVEDTAIVVFGDEQIELDLPEGHDAQAFIKNGVLTVELDQ